MGKSVEKKRKKKGRPSLLDLQKRSLRLQKQREEEELQQQQLKGNPNPNPKNNTNNNSNSYLRVSNSSHRVTRRNPDPREEEEDDEEESGGKRREKKLKLVLRLPPNNGGRSNRSELDSSGSELEGKARLKKKKIDDVGGGDGSGREKSERHSSLTKVNEGDLEPITPLPDKKLLVFILERLQKKDTYGVFSEPVDPSELPDYHDIIEHPMDFSTIRKKLSNGDYVNLEQFEEDVFLISSNAMRYNASDTIYFRQARSIHELAKKDFENLRQESDDNEPEPQVVRRGRPPSKNIIKKPVGRPPAEQTSHTISSSSPFASTTDKSFVFNLSTDMSRKGPADKISTIDPSVRVSQGVRNGENYSWVGEKRLERNEELLGCTSKGLSTRCGKKVVTLEENRRNTYKQSPLTFSGHEPSILTTFDGERKELIPVGLHMEHAYARSLARFAANLGPVGWQIAARQIERVLPPGMKFGRGWVGEKDTPQEHHPPSTSSSSSISPQPVTAPSASMVDHVLERLEQPSSSRLPAGENQPGRPAISNRYSNPAEVAETSKSSYTENSSLHSGASAQPKNSFPLAHNAPVQPLSNGFNAGFSYSLSQVGQMARMARPTGSLATEAQTTHARIPDMDTKSNNSFIHRAHFDTERTKMGPPSMVSTSSSFFHQATSSQSDAGRTKLSSPNMVNFPNSFSHPSAVNNLEIDRTKMDNSNIVNSGNNRYIHPVIGQPEVEIAKLGNTITADYVNRLMMHPEAARDLEAQGLVFNNSSTINHVGSFTHPTGTAMGHMEPDNMKLENPNATMSSSPMPESAQNSQGFWRGLSLHPKQDSAPPDLNVRFQSPGSPASGMVVDSQQPDLALQL